MWFHNRSFDFYKELDCGSHTCRTVALEASWYQRLQHCLHILTWLFCTFLYMDGKLCSQGILGKRPGIGRGGHLESSAVWSAAWMAEKRQKTSGKMSTFIFSESLLYILCLKKCSCHLLMWFTAEVCLPFERHANWDSKHCFAIKY